MSTAVTITSCPRSRQPTSIVGQSALATSRPEGSVGVRVKTLISMWGRSNLAAGAFGPLLYLLTAPSKR